MFSVHPTPRPRRTVLCEALGIPQQNKARRDLMACNNRAYICLHTQSGQLLYNGGSPTAVGHTASRQQADGNRHIYGLNIMDAAEHSCARTDTTIHTRSIPLLLMQQRAVWTTAARWISARSHLLAVTDTPHRKANTPSRLSERFSSRVLTTEPSGSHQPTRLSR